MNKRSSIFEVPRRQRITLLAIAVLLGLNGCTGLRLHDASKSAIADSAQKKFKAAKVTETVDEALANSKLLLDEAERIADLEAEVRKERALLGIAESGRSMAAWLQARWKEQSALGFKDTASAHARLQANTLVEGAKKEAEKNRARFVSYTKDPAILAFLIGPLCGGITADLSPPETSKLNLFDVGFYEADFISYRGSCVALAGAKAAVPDDIVSDSALDLSQKARAAAEADRAAQLSQFGTAKAELDAARKVLKAAQKAGKSDVTKLKEKAGKVSEAAGKVKTLAEKFGLESVPLDNIKHLAVILGAVSSGQVDKEAVASDGRLGKASLVAAELPSLAEDAIALLAEGKAPPTNHLILELNHQQILYNRALALSDLRAEELGLHDQKIAVIEEQAKQYREIQYRLCNYATQTADRDHQGAACAIMSFDTDGAICMIGGPADAQVKIDGCVLVKSWRDNYEGSNDPRAKRQLLAALLAHSRALDAQSAVRKIDFQMIGIGHKRIAASNRAAIAAWNNLVAVPVDTLAAYYAAGIKPDTIASAVAQLLGLLGIGVGIGVSD